MRGGIGLLRCTTVEIPLPRALPMSKTLAFFSVVFWWFVSSVGAQVYRPIENNIMWDSYLMRDGDKYQLFFLQNENYPQVDPRRDSFLLASVGRAESTDLVHWTTRAPLNFETYRNNYSLKRRMFIGQAPVKHRGVYSFFFDPRPRGQAGGSPIYLLQSTDLHSWSPVAGGPFLQPTLPFYGGSAWRDLFLSYDQAESRWHGYLCAQTPTRPKRETPLENFTVALWLEMPQAQRNASAFCIQFADPKGKAFEAVVLDTQRRWVLSSQRERRRLTALPPADPAADNEPVFLAVSYQGAFVHIYRNGTLYATYQGPPLPRRAIVNVTIGRPSAPGAAQSPNYFVGAIDEARIYNQALRGPAIQRLQPTRGAARIDGPVPMAAWTFEDSTPGDQEGSFVMPEMNYGAHIDGGKLQLDGRLAHLYQTAISTPGMSCIAHVTSPDLVQWEYHRPVFASTAFCNVECPDYFQIGDWHYFTFSTVRTRRDTGGRRDASGTYYLRARHRDGPYHLPKQPLLFGSGRGRMDNYVGRAIQHRGEHLLYYHTVHGNIRDCIARPVTWGACKRIVQHSDGTLSLAYWSGVEKLETGAAYVSPSPLDTSRTVGNGNWSQVGDAVAVTVDAGQTSVLWLPVELDDFMFTAHVQLFPQDRLGPLRAGVTWRNRAGVGHLLSIDTTADRLLLGRLRHDAISNTFTETLVDDWQMSQSRQTLHVRVMVRSHRADVYLDDRWVFSTSLLEGPTTGRMGLVVTGGAARFSDLRCAGLSPLLTPTGSE